MKKIVILVLLVVLTGCSATYELSIMNGDITEKLVLKETDVSSFDVMGNNGWSIRELFNSLLTKDDFTNENYVVKSLETDNQLGIQYNNEAKLNEFYSTSIISQCYMNASLTHDNENIIIDSGTEFKCFDYYEYLDSVKVIIKTNHDVIESNATKIDGNTYIWNLTKDSDKQIKLVLKNKENNLNSYILIISIVIASIVIIAFIIRGKFKKINKI